MGGVFVLIIPIVVPCLSPFLLIIEVVWVVGIVRILLRRMTTIIVLGASTRKRRKIRLLKVIMVPLV